MSLRKLLKTKALDRPDRYDWDAPPMALQEFADRPLAAEADDPNTVSIYDVIGEDPWSGGGFTVKRMAAALRSIGKNAVTVNVNSPGGDMFEGLAIYNLLAEHPAKVIVKVMGLAASAASLIAMAGDEVLMGTGSIMMIHKSWGLVAGNEHDFADAASVFKTFDESMAAIYAARTGLNEKEILSMLDGPSRTSDGTYMTATEAIDKGFADGSFASATTDAKAQATLPESISARRKIEAALAKDSKGRKERAEIINSLLGQRDATQPAERDAGDLTTADLMSAVATLRTLNL